MLRRRLLKREETQPRRVNALLAPASVSPARAQRVQQRVPCRPAALPFMECNMPLSVIHSNCLHRLLVPKAHSYVPYHPCPTPHYEVVARQRHG